MQKLWVGRDTIKFLISFLLAMAVTTLAGCGAGGSGTGTTGASGVVASSTQTITGTVATGTPLAGVTVYIKDSTGQIFTSAATGSNGSFSVVVPSGMTLPFMLRVHNPTAANPLDMYSVLTAMASSGANVNITPITTLVMYELNSKTDPGIMYRNTSYSALTSTAVNNAETTVRNTLGSNAAVAAVPSAFSMMYGTFTPSGSSDTTGYDTAIDNIGNITTLSASGGVILTTTSNAASGAGNTTTYAAASSSGQQPSNVPTITMSLTDTTAPYATRTSISSSSPGRVTATVKNASGAAVAGAIVIFSLPSSDTLDKFSGGANAALTDSNGLATVTLTTANTGGGASTVTASSTVNGTALTGTQNFAIGSSTITLSALSLPGSPLSAYGTASVSVQVLNNGILDTTPMTVSFTSACAGASPSKATLTSTVTTVNGVAAASYLDNGCNNINPGDTITATLSNGFSVTGNLPVSSPAIGSIQFVSVVTNPITTPTMITLKGTGGANRSETAKVTFKIVDAAGNPFSAPVTFSLNTTLGGLALSSYSATSDPTTGQAVTNVQAGTFSTAVRVTASICSNNTNPCTGTVLSTQSDQLLVSTGIPSQDAFSLSASTHNIEGWTYDGTTTTLTARLADHFSNPVPDGTAVYFTSEGGSITPSCTTGPPAGPGTCTVTLTSQALRPDSAANGFGRLTVLATAVGEESFTDLNSNGYADPGEMIDANGVSTDIGDAYVDYNENGIWDSASEPYIDFPGVKHFVGATSGVSPFNYVGATSGGDGLYHGVLCNPTAGASFCSPQKSIDVRGSQVIIFSTSHSASDSALAAASAADNNVPLPNPITPPAPQVGSIVLSSCTTLGSGGSIPSTATVTVVDENGNAMPAGTVVTFSTNNGTIPTPSSYTITDTTGCRAGFPGCPAFSASPTFGDIRVSLVSDATWNGTTCTNAQSAGVFTVLVTTPKGNLTTYTISITD